MADFCKQCTADVFGVEYADNNDMAGLCRDDEVAGVLCEHCGNTWVTSDGTCVGPCHEPSHFDAMTEEEED